MFCSISNQIAQQPVVSRTSGYVFERRLIHQYIDEHGRCPITGESLSHNDLLAIQQPCSATGKFTGGGLGSIAVPALLERLADEWDGVMLEQFSLRQQLTQMRQELAHALQQYEAACRVVASLTRQCETAAAAAAITLPDAERLTSQHMQQKHDENATPTGNDLLPFSTRKMPVGEALAREDVSPVVLPAQVCDAMELQERYARRRRKERKMEQQQQQQQHERLKQTPQHDDDASSPHEVGNSSAQAEQMSFTATREITVVPDGATRCVHASRPSLAACPSHLRNAHGAAHAAPIHSGNHFPVVLTTAGGSGGSVVMRLCAASGEVMSMGVGHDSAIHSITTLHAGGAGSERGGEFVVSAAADDSLRVWRSNESNDTTTDTNDAAHKASDSALENGIEDDESNLNSPSHSDAVSHRQRTAPATPAPLICLHTLSFPDGVTALSQTSIEEQYILAGGRQGAVYLCDAERGAQLSSVRMHESAAHYSDSNNDNNDVACVQLHPYGSMAMLADGGGRMALWDVRGMRVDTVLTMKSKQGTYNSAGNHTSRCSIVYDASFSADCVSLAIGFGDGLVALWDLRHVEQPVMMYSLNTQELLSSELSSDFYSSGTATTHNLPASVAFDAQNGSRLLMGGADGALSILNTSRFSGVAGLASNDKDNTSSATLFATSVHSPICSLCWTNGASAFATASLDGVVRLYNVSRSG